MQEGRQLFKKLFFDETHSHLIMDLAYSRSLLLYFVVSDDLKMHLFNEQLKYLGYFPMKNGSVTHVKIIESQRKIVTVGMQSCIIYNLNVKNRKYDPKQMLSIDPESKALEISLKMVSSLEEVNVWL
jgi:hypothetical protein